MESVIDKNVAVSYQLKQVSGMEASMYGNDPFFNQKLKKHTVFDKESISTAEKVVSFGEMCVFDLPVDLCDMISDVNLKVILPNLSVLNSKWTNTIGHSMFEYISITYEDSEVVRYTSEYLHALFMLRTPASKRTARNEMIQHKRTEMATDGQPNILTVEIPLFKSAVDRQMFPILLMKKEAFKIKIKFRSISQCVFIPKNEEPTVKIVAQSDDSVRVFFVHANEEVVRNRDALKLRCSLFYDGYHLTKAEKLMFEVKSGDILFRTVETRTFEWQASQYKKNVDVDFNGMISEIVCFVRDRNSAGTNRYFNFLELSELSLIFQGENRNEAGDPKINYWNRTHTSYPTTWVYSIPFCLSSIQTQPAGQRRFDGKASRSSLAMVKKHSSLADVFVFANTYTVMSFDEGLVRFQSL